MRVEMGGRGWIFGGWGGIFHFGRFLPPVGEEFAGGVARAVAARDRASEYFWDHNKAKIVKVEKLQSQNRHNQNRKKITAKAPTLLHPCVAILAC